MNSRLLVISFVFGLVETAVVASQPLLFRLFAPLTAASAGLLSLGTNGVALFIDPVVVFLVMLFFGRGLDLSAEYGSALSSVFVGTVVGTGVSLVAVTILLGIFGFEGDLYSYLGYSVFYYVLGAFRLTLSAFAGLAFGYFSRPKVALLAPSA